MAKIKRRKLKRFSDTPKGDWKHLIQTRFKGCELLYVSSWDEFYKGYWYIYWLGRTDVVGAIDPCGAATICPATNRFFGKVADVEALVGDAKAGAFPEVRLLTTRKRLKRKRKGVKRREQSKSD